MDLISKIEQKRLQVELFRKMENYKKLGSCAVLEAARMVERVLGLQFDLWNYISNRWIIGLVAREQVLAARSDLKPI